MSQQELMSPTDIASIPSQPEDRQKIEAAIKEVADCLVRKKAETDLITEIADGLKEEFGLSKRLVNSLAKTYNDGDYNSKLATLTEQVDEYEEFYEGIMNRKR